MPLPTADAPAAATERRCRSTDSERGLDRALPRDAPAFDLVEAPLFDRPVEPLLFEPLLFEPPPFAPPLVERRLAVELPRVEPPRADPARVELPRGEPAAPREEDARVPVLAFEAIPTD